MQLSELIKQGFVVKLTYVQGQRRVELEGEPVEVVDDEDLIKPSKGKVSLKSQILVPDLKAKIEAEIECLVRPQENAGHYLLTPSQIIELDGEELDVASNAIEFIQYLPRKQALIISFNRIGQGGRAYVYYRVPAMVYALFSVAESKGRFFHDHIDKRYAEEVIPDDVTVETVEEMIDNYEWKQSQEGQEAELRTQIKNMTAAELLGVAQRKGLNSRVKSALLYNPATPTEALELLSGQLDKAQIRDLVKHPNCSEASLRAAMQTSEEYVREAIASNPRSPVDLLEILLADKSRRVRQAVLENPSLPESAKSSYEAAKGTPQGFVVVSQWHADIAHIDDLRDPSSHTGDAKSINQVLGSPKVEILEKQPQPAIGCVVLRVEGNGVLTLVDANYDTSD